MLDRLVHALVRSSNQAADDLLLQALRLGIETEQAAVLDALLERKTATGLLGVVFEYGRLPQSLQNRILSEIRVFHHALAESCRSEQTALRLSGMKLIALGRQGKLAYVLSENLHNSDETLSKAATEALVALARWSATETRRLQKSADTGKEEEGMRGGRGNGETEKAIGEDQLAAYNELMAQRPEIEAAVARAINLHRGVHAPDLLRAVLLLADWPGSKTLAILHTSKHGGQSPMIRRLQQPPDSEHVEAFLLGASHGQLRSHFAATFARIDEAPVLDALLRKTHWLKDHQLQTCLHQVNRGAWWGMVELARDLERRTPSEAAKIAQWLAISAIHDVEQDERMQLLLDRAHREDQSAPQESLGARVRLLRVAMHRRRDASVRLIRVLLNDPDERVARMAAREIVRRRPADFENVLLKLMAGAPASVRRVIGRAIGQAGFDQFWNKFDKLDKNTRRQAGRAMLKLLPDAAQRLQRRAQNGPAEQRVKAMQIAQELGIAEGLRHTLIQLVSDPNPKVRSKAVAVMADVPDAPGDLLIDRVVNDPDARVRANAIEVLETKNNPEFLPVLAERALSASGRERANAIRAMCRMKVGTASGQLMSMLKDERPDHRISAMWTLRQIGWWSLLNEVGSIAKADTNIRVRRYALGVLKNVAEMLREQKKNAG